jgi:imidazolonepropionase-like amidohydrolase
VMKLDAELGTVEKGKRADLTILDRNPLEDIHNIRTVRWTIAEGKMYPAAELWTSVRFRP